MHVGIDGQLAIGLPSATVSGTTNGESVLAMRALGLADQERRVEARWAYGCTC